MQTPFQLEKAPGIIEWNEDALSSDPAVVVAYPRGPGETFFHVDNLKEIRPGDRIFYIPENANDPVHIKRLVTELHQAHKIAQRYEPLTDDHRRWAQTVCQLERRVLDFYQGRKTSRAIAQVLQIIPDRKLIVVSKPFDIGRKPAILTPVFRITGFNESAINEVATEKMHKEARKLYGSDDWISEFNATKKLPSLTRTHWATGHGAAHGSGHVAGADRPGDGLAQSGQSDPKI